MTTASPTTLPPPLPYAAIAAPLAPVTEAARVGAVDVLRGVAVLGILGMNVISFALPLEAYTDPMHEAVNRYAGPFTGANVVVWLVSHLLIDQKMMTIFSMLFGAGLVLMGGRAGGGGFARVYYRRLGWLFAIGMIHAYVLWYGDVLVTYALCGLVLYPLRNCRPRTLIPVGIAVMLVAVLIELVLGAGLWFVRDRAEQGNADAARVWADMSKEISPTDEVVDEQVRGFRGSPAQVIRANATNALFFQLALFPMLLLWKALGLMLIGMGLMKLGVFSAERSYAFYGRMVLLGYGVGLPMVAIGANDQVRHGFDIVHGMLIGMHYNYVGSLLVALGHAGIVMLVFKSGALRSITDRLAAVGRMALTNYLAQTLICTFIFFGWGLGYFAHVERKWLPLFVVSVWVIELAWSPWWLRRFRLGPLEWVWRSLTYGKRQPFSRADLSSGTI